MIEIDHRIGALARSQHGAVSRSQLLAIGASRRMVDDRLQRRLLTALHPGVYALPGAPQSWERSQIAACLWSRGVAGVRAAAYLHRLPGFESPPVEVITTLNKRPMPRCGIVCHHTTRLPRAQTQRIRNIPATSPERTLFDLCGHIPERRAAIALDHALHMGMCTLGSLDHCLYQTARRGRDGCAVLRRMLHARLDLTDFPNSGLETVIFELLRRGNVPMPQLQWPIRDGVGGFVARPDFVWPAERLVVEGHSRLWHEGLVARRSDALRHDRLVACGYRVLYVTWADATRYGDATLKLIRRALEGAAVPSDVENLRWDVVQLAENG